MLPVAVLSRLLQTLYDAAAGNVPWASFLRELSQIAKADSAALLLHDFAHQQHELSLHWGVDPELVRRYAEYYGAHDVWMRKARPVAYSGWLATSEEVCPSTELVRSEFYSDLLRPNGMFHAMWGVVENSNTESIVVGAYRGRKLEAFGKNDLELLRFLSPHLKRAFRIHFRIAALSTRAGNLELALDLLAIGVILIGRDGRVTHMNQAAKKIVNENDGLRVVEGRLRTERSAETAELQNLLTQAQATSIGKGLGAAGAITISRRSRSALQVLITPINNVNLDADTPVHTIVFVTDPSQGSRPPGNTLYDLFGLTPAESRVAFLLGDGHAPRAIAEMIGVTANTLKSQLASIYRKTGTSRQAQLVRLLSQLAIPLSTGKIPSSRTPQRHD